MDADQNQLEKRVSDLENETQQMKEEICSIYDSVRLCKLSRREYCT
jgi:hypothetical protein